MSGWTSSTDIRKKLAREWAQGKLLATRLIGGELGPRRITLKKPQAGEWAEKWDAVRLWVDELVAAEKKGGFTIELQEVNHRQLGRNRFPHAVLFATDESILSFLGKLSAARTFDALCAEILSHFPALHHWLAHRPLVVLQYAEQWPRLLAVLRYVQNHPRPAIYVRQLEIPELDTKFIEQHTKLLTELLDLILPEAMIDKRASGVKRFAERYGFLAKPIQVRFRILDSAHSIRGMSDIQIPVTEFDQLQLDVDHVFITENEINGLAFPAVNRAIIIFGLGFGLDRLAGIAWLHTKKIQYWGDIDTHGFVMLDQLRSYFPAARSFLMDQETLLAHRFLWGRESCPTTRVLNRLTDDERNVYQLLVNNSLAEALRLEQERIAFDLVGRAIDELTIISSLHGAVNQHHPLSL